MGNSMSSVEPGATGPQDSPRGSDDDLTLSPSETMAHNSAMRLSGSANGQRSTQRALASIVLGFELIVVVLIGLTMFGLGITEPRELGLYLGGGLGLLIIVALGVMRRGKTGIVLGWIVHVLMLLTAILLPMTLIVGILFTALWIYCMIKGAQIDRDRAAWLAQQGDFG